MISQLFLVLQMYCVPYSSLELNNTHSCAIFINVITLFVGIMLIIDYDLEDAAEKAGETYDTSGRSVISGFVFVLNLIPLGLPVLFAARRAGVFNKICALITGGNDILSSDSALKNFVEAKSIGFKSLERNDAGHPRHNANIEQSAVGCASADIVHFSLLTQEETKTETAELTDTQDCPDWQHFFHHNLKLQAELNNYDAIYSFQPMCDNSFESNYLELEGHTA